MMAPIQSMSPVGRLCTLRGCSCRATFSTLAGSLWATGHTKGFRMERVATGMGLVLQLVVGYFTLTAIGLISVDLWAMVVLIGAWVVAVVLLIRLARRAPLVALLVPAGNALVLWGLVAAGGAWLGWTA
jgi:hypothetical protein